MLSRSEASLRRWRERPFAAAQGDTCGSRMRDHAVMLSAAKHLCAEREKPFAAA
jgi:hypothetical protein